MESKIISEVLNEAFDELPRVTEWRRYLHAHPELSFREVHTANFIADVLNREGIEFSTIAGTGILARIEGTGDTVNSERSAVNSELSARNSYRSAVDNEPGAGSGEHESVNGERGTVGSMGGIKNASSGNGVPTKSLSGTKNAIVLRADMDALPITEETGLNYASQNDGVMHACGHDLHAAILLGALRILNRRREHFSGTLFGLFQPGEEKNPGGASLVLKEDPFKDYNILAFVGEHVEPMLPTGIFGFRAGKYMASSDELRFTVRGTGGHAAMRDKIKDPVLAAARLIEALHKIAPEVGSDSLCSGNHNKEILSAAEPCAKEGVGLDNGKEQNTGHDNGKEQDAGPANNPVIISIGKVEAPGATNIVPNEVYMEGTLRTFDERQRAEIKERIHTCAADIALCSGVEIDVDINHGYPVVVNDEGLTAAIAQSAREIFGDSSVVQLGLRPTSEDFGFYSLRYPSVFYRLGVGGTIDEVEHSKAGRVHTARFNPDEKALGYGVAQFVNIVLTLTGRR